jgi:hypothetical protein
MEEVNHASVRSWFPKNYFPEIVLIVSLLGTVAGSCNEALWDSKGVQLVFKSNLCSDYT